MSFNATVENDTIKLPAGVHLPDGTEVTVEPLEKQDSSEKGPNLWTWMEQFAGCIKDAPPDLAAEHDHYAHGAPKGLDPLE